MDITLSEQESRRPDSCMLYLIKYMIALRGERYPHPPDVYTAIDRVFDDLLRNR